VTLIKHSNSFRYNYILVQVWKSNDLRKEWHRDHDYGKSVTLSWLCQTIPHFSHSHEPFVILYLVPHFSEVWKCGKVWQSNNNVTRFPLSRNLCRSLPVLHFSEVWKNEIVRQSQDILALFLKSRIPWHSFLSYTPVWNENKEKRKRVGFISVTHFKSF